MTSTWTLALLPRSSTHTTHARRPRWTRRAPTPRRCPWTCEQSAWPRWLHCVPLAPADRSASLTPVTLLPPLPKPDGERVPATPVAYPTLSPGFQLSPTSNYAAPYGQASLGETLRACVRLRNTSQGAVHGVKMMLEVQSPGGRVRLGEVVHGGARPEGMDPSVAETRAWDELPALAPGGAVDLGGAHELTELGLHILICSVAWETEHGRRTFQRFLKFTVSAGPPLC